MRAITTTLLLGFLLTAAAWGQGVSTINGTVIDPSGAVIPGAKLTVTEVDTSLSRTMNSNADGLYVFSSLRPTRYSLRVEAPGFKNVTQTGITLLANDNVTINLKLELGSASEAVTVEAAASQVDTTSPTISQVIDSDRMAELPLNGRNPAQLTLSVAGAVVGPSNSADQGVTKTFPVVVTASINGTRTNQTSFLLDGVPNIQLLSNVNLPFPMPDALQEFSVQTSNYSAEYGQNAGGVVNIVTKSGTNAFHGSAFGFVRNAVFNARNFFASERDPLKRSQYGATAGGPIRRDKAFFFFGYQGTNIRSETNGLSSFVPTDSNLSGDFSSLLSATNPSNPQGRAINVKDPSSATGQVFAGNLVPLNRLDPASLNLSRNWLPRAGGTGLIFYSRPLAQDFNEFTAKGDYNLSGSDRLGLRYFRDTFNQPGTLVNKNLLTYGDFSTINYTNAVLQETHIFSPSVLNEFRFGVARETDKRGPPPNAPSPQDFGVAGVPPTSIPSIEGITVTSYFSTGTFPPGSFPRVSFMWNDTIRWVRGRHAFAFGGSYERARLEELTETTKGATFNFSGDATGVALADFMLGRLRTFTHGNGTIESNRYNLFSIFAQDTFKVSKRLTLSSGVRWEPSLPWHDRYQTGEIFFPDLYTKGVTSKVFPNALPGELFPGDAGIPQDGRRGDWNNIAPRVGFAYDVFGSGRTSIRGGVGASFDARVPGWNTNRMSQGTPFTLAVTLTSPQGPFSNPYLGIANPFPAPLPPPKSITFPKPVQVFSFDPDMQIRTPVVYNGNLTIEHQLAPNWLVRTAYVGARSLHANVNEEANPAVYIPGSALAVDARRPFQGYGSISVGGIPAGNAWYHSLTVEPAKTPCPRISTFWRTTPGLRLWTICRLMSTPQISVWAANM